MMKYFKNNMTLEEVKAIYKKEALRVHPDVGGSTEQMQQLNNEFDIAFAVAKRYAPVEVKETAKEFTSDFYAQRGWTGKRYTSGLRNKDITAIIRDYVKYVHPTYKFSVSTTDNRIDIALMEYPIEFTNRELVEGYVKSLSPDERCFVPSLNDKLRRCQLTKKQREEFIEWTIQTSGRCELGFGALHKGLCPYINPVIWTVIEDIFNFANSYNFDYSDVMSDYFNTNFYLSMEVGKSEKPAKFVERTARIAPTKEAKGAKRLTA